MFTESTETKTINRYRIPNCNLPLLSEKIEKLSKKSMKLVGKPITFNIISTETVEEKHPTKLISVVKTYKIIELQGIEPKYDGWQFIAVLQPLQDENGNAVNIVKTLPLQTCPQEFRTRVNYCDHCLQSRKRNDTYVVEKDGQYKQVGSSCIKDFLGHGDPSAICSYFELVLSLDEICNEGTYDGVYRGEDKFKLEEILAFTASVIKKDGWTPKSKCGPLDTPTAHTVSSLINIFTYPRPSEAQKEFLEEYMPSDKDYEVARKTIEHWQSIGDTANESTNPNRHHLNDYEYNCVTISRNVFLDIKLLGIACSMVSSYQRNLEQKLKTELEAKTSSWVGQPKDKMLLELKVLGLTVCRPTQWGVPHLYRFVDNNGNMFIWFSSKEVDELEIGKNVKISGSVKEHSEFNGVKQTVLSNCRFKSYL